MQKKLLICSRARYYSSSGSSFFQVNDGKYINEISDLFDETVVLAGEVTEKNISNETLLLNDSIICYNREKLLKKDFFSLINLVKKSDLIYVFYPLQFSLLVAIIAKLQRKKIIGYNGGVWSQMRSFGQIRYFSKKARVLYFDFLEFLSVKLSNAYVVNNNLIFDKYSEDNYIIKTVPILRFGRNDIYLRNRTCIRRKIHLLAVNHVKTGKRIIEILLAFDALCRSLVNFDFNIKIIGRFDQREVYAAEVNSCLAELSTKDQIQFVGIVNDKSLLKEHYRDADILVLASDSEGFPRVIWEAFSQSLPVVCSPLPNILLEFQDSVLPVLFFDDNEYSSIMRALVRVIDDKVLNETLIHEGMLSYKNKTTMTHIGQLEGIINECN